MSREYRQPLLRRHPALAELGWLIWPSGLIRFWSTYPWCPSGGQIYPWIEV
ncbi:MAG: hypothetical protein WBP22_01630 [Candidatus Saccharimonas sp.]